MPIELLNVLLSLFPGSKPLLIGSLSADNFILLHYRYETNFCFAVIKESEYYF